VKVCFSVVAAVIKAVKQAVVVVVVVVIEGGIVNVEVRRQEGSAVDPTTGSTFGSTRASSPRSVVFARTPPLPLDSRFRGFGGGIALHGTDTGGPQLLLEFCYLHSIFHCWLRLL